MPDSQNAVTSRRVHAGQTDQSGLGRFLPRWLADWRGPVQIVLWVALPVFLIPAYLSRLHAGFIGQDAEAYWMTARTPHLYGTPGVQRYLYSPAFAQVIHPLAELPWNAFVTLWIAIEAAAFVWLLWPLDWRWRGIALMLCTRELMLGNVYSLFAVVLVLGFRRPGLWAFPALTKITPALGPVWFAVRREWRALAISLLTTVAIALVSFAIAPGLWREWFDFLRKQRDGSAGFVTRFVVALALTAYGARSGRRWLLAPAMVLATPVIGGPSPLSLLAAIPRLLRRNAKA